MNPKEVIDNLTKQVDQLRETVAKLQADNEMLRRERAEEVWIWQGDGTDHPESIACPTLVHPDDLRKLVATRADALASCAAAISKILPAPLRVEVLAYLDPLSPFVEFLLTGKSTTRPNRETHGRPAFAVCRCGHWETPDHDAAGRCLVCENPDHRYEHYEWLHELRSTPESEAFRRKRLREALASSDRRDLYKDIDVIDAALDELLKPLGRDDEELKRLTKESWTILKAAIVDYIVSEMQAVDDMQLMERFKRRARHDANVLANVIGFNVSGIIAAEKTIALAMIAAFVASRAVGEKS